MPERFGLFTLIVLGESIIAVSVGTIHVDWALGSLFTAAAGFGLAAGLWWLYFARFDDDVFNWALAGGPDARRRSFVYGYSHLLLYPALAAVGVGVRLAIEAAIHPAPGSRAPVVVGLGVAGYLCSVSAIQAAAPRGLTAGVVRARALLIAGVGDRRARSGAVADAGGGAPCGCGGSARGVRAVKHKPLTAAAPGTGP
jgi:low temperature requirement protein LtrA